MCLAGISGRRESWENLDAPLGASQNGSWGIRIDHIRAITDNDELSANFCHGEMIVEVFRLRVEWLW